MQALAEPDTDQGPLPQGAIRRVQVGCGPHHLRAGWWNTDLRAFAGIDEVMDACKPWRWSNELDHVYAEHFIEHLTLDEATSFLVEAGRALRPGGRIRLTTPALEWVLKTHFDVGQQDRHRALSDTFRINRAFHGWGHKFLYSSTMLVSLLEALGFAEVRLCDYGASDDPALCDLELHGEYSVDHGYPSVWIVEATRPTTGIARDPAFEAFADDILGQYLRCGH